MSAPMPTGLRPVPAVRRAKDRFVQALVCLAFVLAIIPLLAVLWMVVRNGLARFDLEFFTHSMRGIGARDAGGGAYHAIVGTLEQVLLTSLISVPIGLFTAIYLVEYGAGGRLARIVGFFVDVMTGIPSVVAGLFILAFWILALGMPFSGFAGALALSILMIPVVVRSSEEMLRLVPRDLREAAYALGVPKWRTIVRVVLPTALPGLVTGVMLAVARVAGETAPLLLTVFFTDSINHDPFHGPQMGLPLFVFDQAGRPSDTAIDRAWTGALTLILIVMLLNLVARAIAWWRSPAKRGS
ncbi:phosphate ABC transporter permease PstA [Thermobispora bispora]|uniref:Phosphate transport system permease protein PstA n=1 Tax=Thermobispora bispora (strain ATCC 19993 / DSM 43833 / CBS 139.67 / JCM 10125 / KCTC 9307 / NBRC 14880 / R51) TaxID=469371 RepID=D6Y6Z2_THEBD|nr:phosphate ABC transporter permease PstA [Thermobispora bispora]ADG89633.1 phosphate ABC transporter, inner membrane subunit PstA [Thermobispora bispora DSM 43833]MBO2475482.1 phosphate ABC transporter, permease protein PstA [Actinomycetales bacterium]MBX6166080.1 phosphate ABC transporter permease PstA [Thermobispora bispora]QSI49247.1 phosphate ABC transporter permease PstA [Thermobispora bispora]